MFIIEDASIFFSFEDACVFPSLSIFEPMPSGICRKNRRRPLLADAFRNTVTSLHALAYQTTPEHLSPSLNGGPPHMLRP